jgi:CRP-like cAMP-binding protein
MMAKDQSIREKVELFFAPYKQRSYSKGQVLVHAGDNPPGVMYLTKGQIRQYDISENGNEVVVNVFKPYAFFPMSWAINKTPNQYFFDADTDVTFRLAPADDVVKFLQENPDVTFDLLSRVYSGTDGLLRRTAHLMGGSATHRVIYELLIEARRFGKEQPDGSHELTITERELANRAGLSRETVSRELRALSDQVTIHRQSILVKDISTLEEKLGDNL